MNKEHAMLDKKQYMADGVDVLELGDGHPLMLIHSLLADRGVFESVEVELARTYRLIMPNLPGHGTSDPLSDPVTIQSYADQVARLSEKLDLPKNTHVLGNGFGGFVSVALAISHGSKFGKFIFADAGAGFPEAAKKPLLAIADNVAAHGMESILDVAIARMFPESYIGDHPAVIEERKKCLRNADPAKFAAAARALADLSLHDSLQNINNSVLVMVGAVDQTTPPDLSREIWHQIKSARYSEIPNCGHCPQVQEPEKFVKLVAEFLGGV